MIEYDYLLKRNEGNEIREFTPNEKIGKKLPNLVLIEAPNSSGKSTLLNIIAVGFYGLKNKEDIVPSLLDDMDNLINSEDQEIEFKIKIDTTDGEIVSEKERNKKEPVVYLIKNGVKEAIAPETFSRKYRLIYDIPDKPRERLKDILKDLGVLYSKIGRDLSEFRSYLTEMLETIKKSKDPEQIKKLEKRIENYQKLLEDRNKKYEGYKLLLDDLKKYAAVKFFIEYYIRYENLSDKFKEIKKSTTKIERKEKQYADTIREMRDLLRDISERGKQIKKNIERWGHPELESEKYRLENDVLNVTDVDSICDPDKRTIATFTLTHLKKIIHDIMEEREKILNRDLVELQVIQKLIEVLKEYESYEDLELPGTNKAINQYLMELEREYENKKFIQEEYESLKNMIKDIEWIESILKETIPYYIEKLGKIERAKDLLNKSVIEHDVESIEKIEGHLKELEKKLDEYSLKCNKYGLKDLKEVVLLKENLEKNDYIREYVNLDERGFNDKFQNLNSMLTKVKEDTIKYNALLEQEEEKLNEIKSLPEHKYLHERVLIEKLSKIVFDIERSFKVTFKNYNDKLQIVRNENIYHRTEEMDKKFMRYHELIGKYLGKKIKEVRYVEGIYQVERVDLLKDTIYTKEGKKIFMSNLGTGHMQAAYIQAVLNRDDQRKIIALFDEISHMDYKTLSPILEKIKELYQSGKLIASIMVQKRTGEVIVKDLERGDLN